MTLLHFEGSSRWQSRSTRAAFEAEPNGIFKPPSALLECRGFSIQSFGEATQQQALPRSGEEISRFRVARCAREAGLWCHMAKPLVLGGSERTMFSATRPLEACGEVASLFTLRHKFSGEKSQLFANIKLPLEGAWISTEIYNISHKHRNR